MNQENMEKAALRVREDLGHTTVLSMYRALFPPVKEGMWGTSSGSRLFWNWVLECECSLGSREETVLDPELRSLAWAQCSEPLGWPLPCSLPTSVAGKGGTQPHLSRLGQTSSPGWGGASQDWFLSSRSLVCVSGLGSLLLQCWKDWDRETLFRILGLLPLKHGERSDLLASLPHRDSGFLHGTLVQ